MDPRLITPTPAGLDRGRPRPVRLASTGRALMLVSALLLLAAPVLAMLLNRAALNEREEQRLLDASAAVSDGVITRLWRPSKESKQPKVAYTFVDAAGYPRNDEAKISPARWATLHVGDRLPIRFVESNPAINLPEGTRPRVMPFFVSYLVAGFLFIGSLLLMIPLRNEWRLLADGRATRAVVKQHFQQKTQHGTQRSMRYEFSLLSGVTVFGKSGTGPKPPAIGSVVWVLYDSEHPRRNKLYPFSLVKLGDAANS